MVVGTGVCDVWVGLRVGVGDDLALLNKDGWVADERKDTDMAGFGDRRSHGHVSLDQRPSERLPEGVRDLDHLHTEAAAAAVFAAVLAMLAVVVVAMVLLAMVLARLVLTIVVVADFIVGLNEHGGYVGVEIGDGSVRDGMTETEFGRGFLNGACYQDHTKRTGADLD